MRVWRLVSHHINPVQVAEIYERQGFIVAGWEHTGDLRELELHSSRKIGRKIKNVWPEAYNHYQNGRALSGFCRDMDFRDRVAVRDGSHSVCLMEVADNYYWFPDEEQTMDAGAL